MEVTAAERTTIYTNISPLAQRVNNYIQTQHSSIAAVAKDIGYSRTTVSRYLTGKYDSNPNDLESKLTDFLTRQTGEAVDLTTPLAESEGKTWQTPVFFESRDAKAVLGVCQSCQEYIGLGIVVARSGYGKTYALRQYAKLSRVAYIECDDTMQKQILGAQKVAEEQSKPLNDNVAKLEREIKSFVTDHRDEMGKTKSMVLTFGEVGFRLSTSVSLPRAKEKLEEIIRRLKSRQMTDCIVVEEKVSKEALKKYGEDTVNAVGATWKQSDVFGYEVNIAKLEQIKAGN